MSIKRFGVVIEGEGKEYSAFVPDLPGCIGAGRSIEDARRDIQSAIQAHLDWLVREGDPIPKPHDVIPVEVPNASVAFVEVEVAEQSRLARG